MVYIKPIIPKILYEVILTHSGLQKQSQMAITDYVDKVSSLDTAHKTAQTRLSLRPFKVNAN